jgi:hypothetical protein
MTYKYYFNSLFCITFDLYQENIDKVSDLNNLSITVLEYEIKKDKPVFRPVIVSKNINFERHLWLLHISGESNSHYVLVKNPSRLLSSQIK